jgi:hypothetical protein
VKLDTFGTSGTTVASGITPGTGGTFTGTFPVPATPGEYLLVGEGSPTATCDAVTIFTVT